MLFFRKLSFLSINLLVADISTPTNSYSLNPEGNTRKLSLEEQLKELGLSLPNLVSTLPALKENMKLPSIPFIIGFFLSRSHFG